MADFPAPWTLTGSGLIIPFLLDSDYKNTHFPGWSGRLAIMMFVKYVSSPVGSYSEWMFVPGKRVNPRGKHFSVDQIRVDSQLSVDCGQQNWGIPKQLANFNIEQTKSNWHMEVSENLGNVVAKGRLLGPSIPIHSAILPFSLYQFWQGEHYWTKPVAKGTGRLFKLESLSVTGDHFPDISTQTRLPAVAISNFTMTFPTAEHFNCGRTTH